jgi:cytochrome c oxidase assembly protein Cox11
VTNIAIEFDQDYGQMPWKFMKMQQETQLNLLQKGEFLVGRA